MRSCASSRKRCAADQAFPTLLRPGSRCTSRAQADARAESNRFITLFFMFVFLEGATGAGKSTVTTRLQQMGYSVHHENFVQLCAGNPDIPPHSLVMQTKWISQLIASLQQHAAAYQRDARSIKHGVVFLDRPPLPFAQLTRAPLISRRSVAPLLPCHCPANAARFPTAAPPHPPRLHHRRLQPACLASFLHRKENCRVRRPPPASCSAVIRPPSRHRLHSVGWSQQPALPPSRDGAAKRQRTQSGRRQATALHTSRSCQRVNGTECVGRGAGGGETAKRAPWGTWHRCQRLRTRLQIAGGAGADTGFIHTRNRAAASLARRFSCCC